MLMLLVPFLKADFSSVKQNAAVSKRVAKTHFDNPIFNFLIWFP